MKIAAKQHGPFQGRKQVRRNRGAFDSLRLTLADRLIELPLYAAKVVNDWLAALRSR